MAALEAAAAAAEIVVGDMPFASGRRQEAPLRASATLIRGDESVCLVSCDVIAVMKDTAEAIAETIRDTCGVPIDNTLVAATHTHHAPRPFPIYGTPRDEELDLKVGYAFDVVAEERLVRRDQISSKVEERTFEIEVRNRKDSDVSGKIEKQLWGIWEVAESDYPHQRKDAQTLQFEIDVAAGETKVVTFKVRFTQR